MRKVGWLVAVAFGFGVFAGCGGSLQTTRTNQTNQAVYKCTFNANERCQVTL